MCIGTNVRKMNCFVRRGFVESFVRLAAVFGMVLIAPSVAAFAQITPPPQQMDLSGYHATFSDDFSNLSLNAQGPGARWITHTPWHGDFGDAIFADPSSGVFKSSPDGLEIIASKGVDGKWRSGLICSAWADNNPTAGFTQKFGYFEMTAELPDGMGTWPAFWLIGSDKRTAAAEIDVVQPACPLPQRLVVRVVADLVRPAGNGGQVVHMVERQQVFHFGLGGRIEMALRQFGDDAVPQRAPCPRCRHDEQGDENDQGEAAQERHWGNPCARG